MLFGNPHIKDPLRETFGKSGQARGCHHGCRNRDDIVALLTYGNQFLGKGRRPCRTTG
ncbi:unannotated protein [freshwater metagenome]|uniref:Unannotated protein n=1 Tax=freshwater metagenome TaxID=449393 RepID=A0A6J6XWH3_9ZZZZ